MSTHLAPISKHNSLVYVPCSLLQVGLDKIEIVMSTATCKREDRHGILNARQSSSASVPHRCTNATVSTTLEFCLQRQPWRNYFDGKRKRQFVARATSSRKYRCQYNVACTDATEKNTFRKELSTRTTQQNSQGYDSCVCVVGRPTCSVCVPDAPPKKKTSGRARSKTHV